MKERLQPVEIALRERVVFVVVAARAVESLRQPDRRGRLDAIGGVFREELLGKDAAFLVQHVIAVESRRDALVESWVWQQVARDLFDGELVERLVRVERANHPVPPRPELAV